MAFSLASITKGAGQKPPIVVIHGSPGIGKSTFGACAPNPIFLRTEDGLGMLSPDTFPMAKTWGDVMSALGAIYSEQHDYKTLVIDSLSALEPVIWAQVAADAKKSSVEELGYGRGYVLALDYWQQLIQGLISIRDDKGITPVLIAHSEVVRYDSPESEPYDRYQIKLHKRAFSLLYERADVIGFANWRTLITKTEVGFNKSISRGTGTGERLLRLIERPAYIAKNRYGMPETIPLDWQAFAGSLPAQ